MPVPFLQKIAKDTGKSLADLEKEWEEAKKKAAEQGDADNFALITTIFKSAIGLKDSRLEKVIEKAKKLLGGEL
jgi:hypothetical protein